MSNICQGRADSCVILALKLNQIDSSISKVVIINRLFDNYMGGRERDRKGRRKLEGTFLELVQTSQPASPVSRPVIRPLGPETISIVGLTQLAQLGLA